MSSPGPELTVLMTVRNGEPYLREAVESILKQTFRDFHFLVLDNASTDNSREVIQGFKDGRIELVELPEDIGQTAALNRGLQMIETPWVARMDADDVSLPGRLEMQMSYLGDHADLVLLGTGIRWIDEDGKVFREPPIHLAEVDLRWESLLGYGGFAHSSVVYSLAAVRQVGGYPEQYRHVQDYDLWCSLLDSGHVAKIPDRLVHIRRHRSNATEPERAERELRSVMKERIAGLFPDPSDETIWEMVRALRYDAGLHPSSSALEALAAAPVRFAEANGGGPSRAALRNYRARWLHLARVSSLTHRPTALSWIRLALRIDPALLVHPSFWYTLASVALAPVRRRKMGDQVAAAAGYSQRGIR